MSLERRKGISLTRRNFIAYTTLAAVAGAVATSCNSGGPDSRPPPRPAVLKNANDWDEVRQHFGLSPDYIHISALFIASHPKPVREAIEGYRRELDENPVLYLQQEYRRRVNHVLSAAARYLGVDTPTDIALTDSTTMGLGLVYNGLCLGAGAEVLTTEQDYYVTHEALRLASERQRIAVRQISLYDMIDTVSEDSLTDTIARGIKPETHVLALTWVHSGTGLKLFLRRIAEAVREINARCEEADHILICVDAVHGFGVEDVEMADIGCDFFIAGCHKWLFGPRGTGLVWGSVHGWQHVLPTVPSFLDNGTRDAWITGTDVTGRTTGERMSPGGFKPFEHQWALTEAFAFHQEIGKSRVAARTHELSRKLKEGLAEMPHITLHTPRAESLSSGIVCFDVNGMSPYAAVDRLRERRIVATVTPYAARYVRLAPSIRNTPGGNRGGLARNSGPGLNRREAIKAQVPSALREAS